jgi:DinB superfamily
VAGKRADTLLSTMLFIEMYTLHRAWGGLTDDEFHWEPLPGSWGVHPASEARTATPFVTGAWAADFDAGIATAAVEGRASEPLTTIAWLLWHVGSLPGRLVELDFLGGGHTTDSGWVSPYIAPHPVFTTADEAVATMRDGWRALDRALHEATDEQLEVPTRFWGYGGPGPETIGAHVVAAALSEVSHHATQVCVLRDLHRLTHGAGVPGT